MDVASRVAAGILGNALKQQRKHRQRHMAWIRCGAQASQSFGDRRVIGAPTVVTEPDLRLVLGWVPGALGELQASQV